jgi:hypothetical protein
MFSIVSLFAVFSVFNNDMIFLKLALLNNLPLLPFCLGSRHNSISFVAPVWLRHILQLRIFNEYSLIINT